jgi:hypothetical protein
MVSMQINKINALTSLVVASGLCLVQSGNASATTMSLSYEETATGITGNGAGTDFTSLPASAGYTNTFGASAGDLTGAPGYSFYDDYIFTVANATVDSVTSEINLGTLSLGSLQERLYSTTGNTTLPILGTPAGLQVPWTTAVGFTAGTETGMFTVMSPKTLTAGTYVLEIRGEVTGASGGTYSGQLNLNPVPLPAALPLLLSGLSLLGGLVRKRFV